MSEVSTDFSIRSSISGYNLLAFSTALHIRSRPTPHLAYNGRRTVAGAADQEMQDDRLTEYNVLEKKDNLTKKK